MGGQKYPISYLSEVWMSGLHSELFSQTSYLMVEDYILVRLSMGYARRQLEQDQLVTHLLVAKQTAQCQVCCHLVARAYDEVYS